MGVTLRELVAVVAELRATSKKSAKLALLAGALRGLRGREAELLASYLVAVLPRAASGWAGARSRRRPARPRPRLWASR